MGFIIDKQTLRDLGIFEKRGTDSIYSIFNSTCTKGGANLLEEWFLYPLDQAEKINKRAATIHFFQVKKMGFPFRGEALDAAEYYLSRNDQRSRLEKQDRKLEQKFCNYIGANTEYKVICRGVGACLEIMGQLKNVLAQMSGSEEEYPLQKETIPLSELFADERLNWTFSGKENKKLDYDQVVVYDEILRFQKRDAVLYMLSFIYLLDVYVSVARVADKRGFKVGTALENGPNVIQVKGLYHPLIQHPVANDIYMESGKNVVFLTGANMAGKSTFMKSLGIAVFLAHVGFPVPAESMSFTVQNGLYTTINLPDNINMGYSHFYAEVLRVKRVAEQVVRYPRLVVIFDELFRGTNVQDAYEATVAVTRAFMAYRESTFVISTHIIEAGETLQQEKLNIQYVYLPTVVKGSQPEYTYRLTPGITADRHGMKIINNEKILDILREGINN